MISRISGTLRDIRNSSVVIDLGGICYDINVSGWTLEKLKHREAMGKPIDFFTLHFIEGNVALGNLTPRLIGFLEEAERKFFEIFTTVKGVGIRKALNAMNHPVQDIAAAIETADTVFLKSLPDIGPRTADRIIAELKGKMASLVRIPESESPEIPLEKKPQPSLKAEAQEILLQLGYKRNEAEQLIQKTLDGKPHIKEVDELIQAAFRQQK